MLNHLNSYSSQRYVHYQTPQNSRMALAQDAFVLPKYSAHPVLVSPSAPLVRVNHNPPQMRPVSSFIHTQSPHGMPLALELTAIDPRLSQGITRVSKIKRSMESAQQPSSHWKMADTELTYQRRYTGRARSIPQRLSHWNSVAGGTTLLEWKKAFKKSQQFSADEV